MSQLKITNAGATYKDEVFAGQEIQNITHFLFANVPGLSPTDPIDLEQPVPTTNIVHVAPIGRVSRLNDNAVVMSATLGYDIGDFDYNWYGAVATKADGSEVLIAVVHTPLQVKHKTAGPIVGNYSVKSIVWRTSAIAQTLNVSLSTLPWQVNTGNFVTTEDFNTAMNLKLDKTAQAVDSFKLEGSSKAQVIASARSGLAADNHSHTASDVGADTRAQSQARVDVAQVETQAKTINGKALSTNPILGASDVGSYTKAESDALRDSAINYILGAPPATLETIDLIAAAIGDDPNFAVTMTSLIGTKLDKTAKAADSSKLNGATDATSASANTIAKRDSSGDLSVRLLKSNYANQSTISGAMAFRINNGADSYTRYCSSPSAIRAWLGALSTTGKAADSDKLDGINSSSFLRSDANDTVTGIVTFTKQIQADGGIQLGTDDYISFDNANSYYMRESNGSYGTISVHGERNGYAGYSIQDRVVLMHDGSNTMGLYNDVNNRWMTLGYLNGGYGLYYAGARKLTTIADGTHIDGRLYATSMVEAPTIRVSNDTDTFMNSSGVFDDGKRVYSPNNPQPVPSLSGAYPVGSIYMNAANSANPSSLFGFGTWVSFGQGRVLIGAGTGTDDRSEAKAFTNGSSGGEYNHILTKNEMPSHSHSFPLGNYGDGGANMTPNNTTNRVGKTQYTNSQGGNAPHNNIQPYITVYMWRRTA